jgi:hypothetical protein
MSAEVVGGGVLAARQRELVLHQRMRDDVDLGIIHGGLFWVYLEL